MIVFWKVMTWHHDMTSKCDVKAWNDIITSEAPSSISWILFLFSREPTLVTKTPKRFQAKQLRHDIFMTSCHDVLNTEYSTPLLFHHSTTLYSGSSRDRTKILFFNSMVFWVEKIIGLEADTWSWSVTLYVKVTKSYKWLILSWALCMLETWTYFVSMVFRIREVDDMWARYAWPWRLTLYVEFTWTYNVMWSCNGLDKIFGIFFLSDSVASDRGPRYLRSLSDSVLLDQGPCSF